MNKGMAEATRLTRAGRLAEATALIQSTLWSSLGAPPTPDAPAGEGYLAHTASPASRPIALPGVTTGERGAQRAETTAAARARVGTPDPASVAPPAGRFVSGSYTNRDGTRAYKLYIPTGSTGQPLPLLVMLHGCTQNAEDLATGTRMNALAESGVFLVVYPEQAASANASRCWNWFETGDQRRDRGEPSIIAGITRQIAATQPIDTRRIYVAGMSAGGAMAAVMGATYPDLYAAVGVHSGVAYGAAHDLPSAFRAMKQGASHAARAKTRTAEDIGAGEPGRAVPTIVFHGDRDGTVHRRNGEQVLHQSSGVGTTGRDAGGDDPRVTVRRGQAPGGRAYTRSVYHDATGRPVAEQWLVHGAGHAWSGGSVRGSYTDAHGPDASAEMVRFFLDHPYRTV
ncbi:MAG: PHB depolymerase family esterase [Rubrobacter sp.]|nr:PHB depolymerase family esterase [Rubrobacter sp.]